MPKSRFYNLKRLVVETETLKCAWARVRANKGAPMVYMVVPLVSYDAAAVLASWFGVGVLASIHMESCRPAAKECLAVKRHLQK